MRSVIGRIAGPESPPVMVWILGLNVSVSMAIPRNVFATVNASAPASSAARASSEMSVTFGESLMITGLRERALSMLTSCRVNSGLWPKTIPPCLVFGQEMLISYAAIPSHGLSLSTTSAYSSSLKPNTFTKTAQPDSRRNGILSRMNASTPTFSRPIEFSIPAAVGKSLGGRLPSIGRADVPFTQIPPIRLRSANRSNSSPYPKVPLAAMTGLVRRMPANSIERFTVSIITWDIIPSRHVFEAQLSINEDGRGLRHSGSDGRRNPEGQQRQARCADWNSKARSADGAADGHSDGGKDAAGAADWYARH